MLDLCTPLVRRENLSTLDEDILNWSVLSTSANTSNLIHDIHSINDLAKDRVLV